MGGYNDLKTAIAALIRTNDNQEITGATLQSVLLSIINTIGQGSVFKGVATTSTNPGNPDANVFYIAGHPEYYPNFNLELTAGLHVIENKSGTWVNTEIVLDVVDAINIGGAKHVKPSQAMMIALQSVEQIPDSEGHNNAMWWSTDGNLKYKQNDTVYNLGAPAYVLYYCGDQIYKWIGSGFREIGGGGTFASGEAVSNMSIFDDGSDTDGKSSTQLAAMIPSGAVIRSLLDLIGSIDTSGGSYNGIDLITTFSYDAPTRVITVKQSGRQAKTIILPLANSTNAGLMSSEDKTTLANVQSLIGRTVNSFSKSTGETGITITLVTSNGTPHAVLIPIDSVLSSQSTSNLVTGAAIYNFLMTGFVYLDQDSRAYAPYTRILPLVSMGSALDNGNTPAQINANEFRYDPTTKRIYRHNNNSQPYFMPDTSQIYLNICTGKMYKWTGSDMEEISGGVDPSTLAGKADKHVAADILAPSQWPRVMLYNIESMWGAGGTPPDYASIPVGSIYLDDSDSVDDPPYRRLFYKKTLEGTSQRIDLGAPQENTIYCHIATGKLYRWIPTQNGNDGAFQQIGGSGTVTGVSVNNGQVNTPNQNGVINLNIQIPQSGLQQSDIDIETQEDGTVDVTVGTNQYNINLNHTHEGMAKLVVDTAANLPDASEMENDTIYGELDDGEIATIYLGGYPFYGGGGGTSSGPVLRRPADGATIDMGQTTSGTVSKTINVKGKSLTQALTIQLNRTGYSFGTTQPSGVTRDSATQLTVTAAAANALNGVDIVVVYTGNDTDENASGTLGITSAAPDNISVEATLVANKVTYEELRGVKLTGTQWLQTDYHPNANTEFSLSCRFEQRSDTQSTSKDLFEGYILGCKPSTSGKYFSLRNMNAISSNVYNPWNIGFTNETSIMYGSDYQIISIGNSANTRPYILVDPVRIYYTKGTSNGTFGFTDGTHTLTKPTSLKSSTEENAMMIGRYENDDKAMTYSIWNLTIYSLVITENGDEVRHWVPKMKNGTIPGLYDTVTGKFISSETSTELIAVN